MDIKCPLCDTVCRGYMGLQKHAVQKHPNITPEKMYELLGNKPRPLCACDCGAQTSFKSLSQGYAKWVKGHHRRKHRRTAGAPKCTCGCGGTTAWRQDKGAYNKYIHGHNSRGKPSPFKGLTKDTCKKFMQQSATIMANARERQRRSELWTKLHSNGKMPVGPKHHNWKGGTAKFGERLTGHARLYRDWKLPKLTAANFSCRLCGNGSGNIHVHHDDEAMHEIIKRVVGDVSVLSNDEKREYVNLVVDAHIDECISAVVLCSTCHEKLHNTKGIRTARHLADELASFVFDIVPDIQVNHTTCTHELLAKNQIISCGDLFRTAGPILDDARYIDKRAASYGDTGVGFFHVFEDEWRDKRPIVESMVRARLGATALRYDARKCSVAKLAKSKDDIALRREFFSETHIDGDVNSSHAYALIHNGDPVAMLSLRRPNAGDWRKMGAWEVARFSTALNSRVRGGLGRLISAAHRDVAHDAPIVTYVDMRHGRGASYEAVGFKTAGLTAAPNFWWTDFHDRYHRMKFKANKARGMSEHEVAEDAGVVRIYGCRNMRFELR